MTVSMTKSQSARSARSVVVVTRLSDRGGVLGVALALLDLGRQRLVDRDEHRSALLARSRLHDHRGAGGGRDLGDAAAHDARAHDADVLEAHGGTLALPPGNGRWETGPVTATTVLGRITRRAGVVAARRTRAHSRDGANVVIVPTAAAFTGLERGGERNRDDARRVRRCRRSVDGRAIGRDALDTSMAERLRGADLVVLSDGSSLHAKSVWRATPFGEAIRDARRPRRRRFGRVGARRRHDRPARRRADDGPRVPTRASSSVHAESPEQMSRTRSLLAPTSTSPCWEREGSSRSRIGGSSLTTCSSPEAKRSSSSSDRHRDVVPNATGSSAAARP